MFIEFFYRWVLPPTEMVLEKKNIVLHKVVIIILNFLRIFILSKSKLLATYQSQCINYFYIQFDFEME